MSAIRSFVRREPVLLIAVFAAVVSCCFVPPDSAYLSYIDCRTLSLLYCLMTVVAGLRQAGSRIWPTRSAGVSAASGASGCC